MQKKTSYLRFPRALAAAPSLHSSFFRREGESGWDGTNLARRGDGCFPSLFALSILSNLLSFPIISFFALDIICRSVDASNSLLCTVPSNSVISDSLASSFAFIFATMLSYAFLILFNSASLPPRAYPFSTSSFCLSMSICLSLSSMLRCNTFTLPSAIILFRFSDSNAALLWLIDAFAFFVAADDVATDFCNSAICLLSSISAFSDEFALTADLKALPSSKWYLSRTSASSCLVFSSSALLPSTAAFR
mmetsp:Transcript_15041/g.38035  ORF Transcript_15041/g.38035 Transcript_15041/m.38035 type:complete len:249 (-) Transcript_15041:558-1304(-)